MDSQQLYCQTHVSSQAADPDTGQHKDKLKVGHVHYVSYPVGPLFAGFGGPKYESSLSL
jgi:hypothetical protein